MFGSVKSMANTGLPVTILGTSYAALAVADDLVVLGIFQLYLLQIGRGMAAALLAISP
jgi:hypothetical protein